MASISAVICCYNSSAVIKETLEYLKAQVFGHEQWEVIVVDNNSTDNTAEIAHEAWSHNPPVNIDFKVVFEPNPGLANARLKGVSEAKFPVISFIDDDNHVPENWIEYQSKVFENSEIGILGCTAVGKFENNPPEWYEEHKHSFATGRLYEGDFIEITDLGGVYGAGMCMQKEIFTKLAEKGWSPLLSGRKGNSQSGGEDTELCLAARLLGYKLFYTNKIEIGHLILDSRITWERLKKMTHGFGAADVFTLVYDIVYQESKGRTAAIQSLRKKWWFNYLGKRINLALKRGVMKDKRQQELYDIRMLAFCETISLEKKRFEESFSHLESIFGIN